MASVFGGIDIFKLVWEKTLLDKNQYAENDKNQYAENGVSKKLVFFIDELT